VGSDSKGETTETLRIENTGIQPLPHAKQGDHSASADNKPSRSAASSKLAGSGAGGIGDSQEFRTLGRPKRNRQRQRDWQRRSRQLLLPPEAAVHRQDAW